jgi:hypothetical protein
MNGSLVRHLIVKDFELHRVPILASIAVGAFCLVLFQWRGLTGLAGVVGFFTALIVLGSILPHSTIVNERKTQSLAFVMSLPISSMQYTTAKILAALGMFMIPWLTLAGGAISLILGSHDIANGIIPFALILIVLPLVGFCLTTAVALVGESEGWAIAATIGCNVSYSMAWPIMISNVELRAGLASPVALWSPAVLTVLGWEFVAIVSILAITLYLQSRKRDFV